MKSKSKLKFLLMLFLSQLVLSIFLSGFIGKNICERKAYYVGLEYRYGFESGINSGEVCDVYIDDDRWIGISTYYEWNEIRR